MEMLKWLLIIIAVIIVIVIIRKYKRPRLEPLNIISGGLGSGKTASCVCRVKSYLRRVYFLFKNRSIKNDYIIYSNIPLGKLDKKKRYRYIRVWFFKKIKCYDLTLDILTMLARLPQDEVIIIADEFSQIASQFDFGNLIVKDNIDEFVSKFRHYTKGSGLFFAIDQCSQNIFLQVRRRSNYCYNMNSCFKIPLLPITIFSYRKISLSDEVENKVELENQTDEKELRRFIFFMNPFKLYNSYAYYERYRAVSKIDNPNFSLTNYRNDVLRLNKKGCLYYETLKYDGYDEEKYLEENERKWKK